ncbi:MAG TPA: DUF1033 family protein [Ureibacillus sp.]|nr:DUF1033 family protein [Ureibacillus sp.]
MSKYKLIYMKADYEPWWLFEGWEEYIVSTESFESEEALDAALLNKLIQYREKYPHEKNKEQKYYAFWTDEESEYCEACEEDTQIYHGIIVERD